ncbi:MAG: hypothetical protein COV91_05070 [Candidatus Taylorbacteria bacterium CG11_big_fil_rev_8_21_14_0_20_46_11]|uniref:Uncharacterized protein n=1 Tax=Candidatus Taylorbacteria bacterium CG11_big_fil_rev_8_21_14_0_20_46_11 TaxID=1975025 RepID=A0A2H0KAI2_9BACT|nr:MAG: hypothetical protein COV91_05070 [Candidatus Taylorbacteria bacterium CG11_big_fil_rev_8_21_14_0_20_46_11]
MAESGSFNFGLFSAVTKPMLVFASKKGKDTYMPDLRQISESRAKCLEVVRKLKERFPDLERRARVVPQFDYVQVFFQEGEKVDLPEQIDDIPISLFDSKGRYI